MNLNHSAPSINDDIQNDIEIAHAVDINDRHMDVVLP